MILRSFAALAVLTAASSAQAAETLHVYGPGGPAPAMKEAAKAFEARSGVTVEVVAGPTPSWLQAAKSNADVVFSGSETMMTDLAGQMEGAIDPASVTPLYLRPAAILVRPGNPAHIHGLGDLFRPGHRVLVVNGAGQSGLWEDMAGRAGDLRSVTALRSNIAVFAKTSAEAKAAWTADPTLDAWIIWNIWQVANPNLAQVVPVEPQYRIYRDAGAALTHKGEADPQARAFITFLKSPEAAAIWARWGWTGPGAAEARQP
jgi:accessory colonization factor AcfC